VAIIQSGACMMLALLPLLLLIGDHRGVTGMLMRMMMAAMIAVIGSPSII
jgi:hypothetical protein